MSNLKKIVATAILIGFCVLLVWAGRQTIFRTSQLSKDAMDLVRSKGSPSAEIWIVEYSDYQCTACRAAYYILEEVHKLFPQDVYLQARFFPLLRHNYGLKSAIYAAAAAEQDKFWPYHAILFEKQPEWHEASGDKIDDLFEGYAKEVGLDVQKLKAAVSDPKTKEKVTDETEKAKSMGVHITPTFFINGKMVAGMKALKEELKSVLHLEESVPHEA
jgi:protein-disulfide isomerase